MLPGARFARVAMIIVAAIVVLGLVLSAMYAPHAL
jgi:hypothetical protein